MEFNSLLDGLEEEVIEMASEGLKQFQDAIAEKRLVLTAELMNQIRFHIIRSAQTWAVEWEFNGYGRFKDMAQLRYAHQAPVDEMEFFIEKRGLDRFAWVPGYKGQAIPTVNNAVRRMAWAMAIARKKAPSIPRGYRGTWYNQSKVEIIRRAKQRLSWKASMMITHAVAESWSNPTDDKYRR